MQLNNKHLNTKQKKSVLIALTPPPNPNEIFCIVFIFKILV